MQDHDPQHAAKLLGGDKMKGIPVFLSAENNIKLLKLAVKSIFNKVLHF